MYINISYIFHRIPDTQSHFIIKVHDLLGQPSYNVRTEIMMKSIYAGRQAITKKVSSCGPCGRQSGFETVVFYCV